jgi:hypothetical protein
MESTPDRGYKYIMNYQDHFSKMNILRPLRSKKAAEVAYNLIDIFCLVTPPAVLQSDNGREFVAEVHCNRGDEIHMANPEDCARGTSAPTDSGKH